MRWYSLILGLIMTVCLLPQAKAQGGGEKPKLYQLSGLIVNKETMEPIPFGTVRVLNTRRGIAANAQGFFSLPVIETDTVIFMSLGYEPSLLMVGDYLENYLGDKDSPYLYAIHCLKEDSIELDAVTIFPYDTPGKLKTALVALGSQKTLQEQYAEDNLDPAIMDDLIKNMTVDDGERIVVARSLYYQQQQTQNIAPVMPLFDPVAVYSLLKYINDKAKDKRDKNLNYWQD